MNECNLLCELLSNFLTCDKFKHFHNDIMDFINFFNNIPNDTLSVTQLNLIKKIISKLQFNNFWDKNLSNKAWLPTFNYMSKIVKQLNTSFDFSSVFTTQQKVKTLNRSSVDEHIDITYSRKIRIFPNKEQLILFSKCLGTSRFIYNQGVDFINKEFSQQKIKFFEMAKEGCIKCKKPLHNTFFCKKHQNCKLPWKLTTSHIALRNAVLINDKDLSDDLKWQSEIPYDTRQLMLKNLAGNYKSARTNLKNGNITHFKLNFRSKKDLTQVFFVNKKAMNNLDIFRTRLNKHSKLRTRKKYKKYKQYKPTSDFIIMKQKSKYYILLTKTRKTSYEKAIYNTVALDPGVRTFETLYSPDGLVGKLGDKLNIRIRLLQEREDRLYSLKSKATGRTKYNMNKRIEKIKDKIKEIVRDQHWKISSFLCKNFENIIIPQFGVKEMSKKEGRTIGKKTTREMLSLSHGSFLEKLKYKCSEKQRNLYIVTEEYTTKTCGGCGRLNNVGSSKTYKCAKCKIEIDRDYNGARNIYLKALQGLDTTL